jgi:FRG domain
MPDPTLIARGLDLRCLSVMQHYEIPTRLLDWSADFWTAVYFACASDPGNNAELWCYDRRMFDTQRSNDPSLNALVDASPLPGQEPQVLLRRDENLIVELDPQITPRMKRQLAHHTVSTNVFADHGPLLFDLQKTEFPNVGNPQYLHRYIIEDSCKIKGLQFLATSKNITASTVFPDVVGLGRFLRWQFESLRTMLL